MMSSGKFHSHSKKAKEKDPTDHNVVECNHRFNGQFIHYKPERATEGKAMIVIKESERTRELIIPDPNPIDIPKILPKSEMVRLQNQGHVFTIEEKKKIMEEAEQKRLKLAAESEQRKAFLAKRAKQGPKQTKLDILQSEAKRKNLYTLQRAYEMRQDQEDEVKKVNAVILAAKCKAIRDAQVSEKELMQKELTQEEKRIDMMMEQRRLIAIKEEEMKKQREEDKKQKFVKEVRNQMQENEILRILEAEKLEEEAKQLHKLNIAIQREEEELFKRKLEQKKQMREDLEKANDEMEYFKKVRAEEERIADLRIKEFMRKKMEREERREEEIKLERLAKEREIARLRGLQERAQDAQAIAHEMNARRIHDEAERAWRQKELNEAQKRKSAIEDLLVQRTKQVEDIRRAQALEMERDKRQFLELAKMQKAGYNKEMENIRLRKEAAHKYRKDLLQQVSTKERERIQENKDKFEEGDAMKKEEAMRNKRIKETIKSKIDNLRSTNMPQKYIADIERQLKTML